MSRITSTLMFVIVAMSLFLSACTASPSGMGMGAGNGMMERHHAKIPAEYAGLTNPILADEASLERGATLYVANCASCHGDGGMGDGAAGSALDPAPSPVAHTSQMMGDAYLFWRISEGGVPFETAMPVWKGTLDESARWDLINYVRALGAGTAKPVKGVGGAAYDPTAQAAHQAEMLAQAVKQGVITQAETNLFATVHEAIEQYRAEHPEMLNKYENATERQATILAALVTENVITQEQADAFTNIHDRLGASGLMQ